MTGQQTRRGLPLVLCLLFSVFLWGCASRAPAPSDLPPSFSPEDAWRRFQAAAHVGEALAGPFRVSASLTYMTPQESQRVNVYFWGNGSHLAPYPLRLDIMAGPGVIAAKIREGDDIFLAYVPRDHAAYVHPGGRLNLLAFGVPLPFSLEDLSLLLTGQYNLLFFDENAVGRAVPMPEAAVAAGEAFVFSLRSARLPGELELNAEGFPVSWSELSGGGWRMELEYWEQSTRITPRRIRLSHPRGMEAVILVRELDRPEAFSSDQLGLIPPPGTISKPLREE